MKALSDINAFVEIDYGNHLVRYKIDRVNDINLRIWSLQDTDMGFDEKMEMGFDLAFGGCMGQRFLVVKENE